MRALALALLLLPAPAWAGATVWSPKRIASGPVGHTFEPTADLGRYPAENAIDGDPKTTFVVKKGEVLRIDLGGKPRLHHLELIPGYAKNDKVWRANRRVTKVRARTWLDGEARPWKIGELDPPDALPKGDPPWLGVDFGRELPADTIELEVLESEGSKGKGSDDICISEIVLLTFDDQPPQATAYTYDTQRSNDRDALPFERFSLDGARCKDLQHGNTGGALTVFVGDCRIRDGKLRLEGALEVREPDGVERTPIDRAFSFRRVNDRIVIVDGHVFSR